MERESTSEVIGMASLLTGPYRKHLGVLNHRLSTQEFTDLTELEIVILHEWETPIFILKNRILYAQTLQNVHKIESGENK